jgi:lysozyme family protein
MSDFKISEIKTFKLDNGQYIQRPPVLKASVDENIASNKWDVLQPAYEAMLDEMVIRDEWKGRVTQAGNNLIAVSDRYLTVQTATGVDWEFIAAVHYREAAGNFKLDLRQGAPIKAATWEADTINALAEQGVTQLWKDNPKDSQTEEFALWLAERWNGFGYRLNRYGPSPYVWSGTSLYTVGKYSSDGHYDPNLVDKQIGFAPLYMDLKGASMSDNVGPPPPSGNSEICIVEGICNYLWNVGAALAGKAMTPSSNTSPPKQ